MIGIISLPPHKRLQGQNASIGIGLIELNEPSDKFNYN